MYFVTYKALLFMIRELYSCTVLVFEWFFRKCIRVAYSTRRILIYCTVYLLNWTVYYTFNRGNNWWC